MSVDRMPGRADGTTTGVGDGGPAHTPKGGAHAALAAFLGDADARMEAIAVGAVAQAWGMDSRTVDWDTDGGEYRMVNVCLETWRLARLVCSLGERLRAGRPPVGEQRVDRAYLPVVQVALAEHGYRAVEVAEDLTRPDAVLFAVAPASGLVSGGEGVVG